MILSDNDLMILEQLTYLNSEVAKAAGLKSQSVIKNGKNKTIGDILSVFTEEKLRNLEENAKAIGCQKEALDYIECLPYEDITVVGHSKGGNKAMYVAVTSGKVSRNISMDGQGFSKEFIDKYWAEINEKGAIITNYSVSSDYVHVLLFPVPNSNQIL